jgi:ABC-type sugar transport system ATPase subunit
VAIGRAIVKRPRLFLFDKPLSNLDAELRTQMRVELAKLHRTMKATMVYITHDQTEAMTMADRIVVLRGGNIEQVGKPVDLYRNPDNAFIASFIGSPKINFFDVDGGRATAPFPSGAPFCRSDGRRKAGAHPSCAVRPPIRRDRGDCRAPWPRVIPLRPDARWIAGDDSGAQRGAGWRR